MELRVQTEILLAIKMMYIQIHSNYRQYYNGQHCKFIFEGKPLLFLCDCLMFECLCQNINIFKSSNCVPSEECQYDVLPPAITDRIVICALNKLGVISYRVISLKRGSGHDADLIFISLNTSE